jgi:membrane-bound serine protease (ClpP class)
MSVLESPILPDLVYLVLLAGLWLAALSVVAPGTGLIELSALAALVLAGFGMLQLEVNAWALAVLAVGAVFFGLSVWRRGQALWLALAAITLSLGSSFLFRAVDGGPGVHPLLTVVTTVLTLGYFWLAIRKALLAARARPNIDPSAVMGLVGEARSDLDPNGSVYVGGELWTARADQRIPAGAAVRVVERDGLILTVEPVEQS